MNRDELLHQLRLLSSGTIAVLIGDGRYAAIDAAQNTWIQAAFNLSDVEIKTFGSWRDFVENHPA